MVKKKKKKKDVKFKRISDEEILGKPDPKRLREIKAEQEQLTRETSKGGLFFKR